MDFAALKTFFRGGSDLRSAPLYFARPPLAAFNICLAPIGQTKILRDRAVGLVNSPQVSIYFEYLFIYFSGYFYCFFSFSLFLPCFPIAQLMHLCKYCLLLFKKDTAPYKMFLKG